MRDRKFRVYTNNKPLPQIVRAWDFNLDKDGVATFTRGGLMYKKISTVILNVKQVIEEV